VALRHSKLAAQGWHTAPVLLVFMSGERHGVQVLSADACDPRRHTHWPGLNPSKMRSDGHAWQSDASAMPVAEVNAPAAHATTFGRSAALATGQKKWRGHGLHKSKRPSRKRPAAHTHWSFDAAPVVAVVSCASCVLHSVRFSFKQYEPTGHVSQTPLLFKKLPATHRHAAAEELFASECDPALHTVCRLFAQKLPAAHARHVLLPMHVAAPLSEQYEPGVHLQS